MAAAPILRMLRSTVGMSQVLFGSDYPYLRRGLAVACRNEVETSAELDREDSRAVLSGNAVKLLPRLAGLAQKRTKTLEPPSPPVRRGDGERCKAAENCIREWRKNGG